MIRFALIALLLPANALAGVFVAQDRELLDPTKKEQPSVVLGFDETLHRATVTVTEDEGAFTKTWNYKGVKPGAEYRIDWNQPDGDHGYTVAVEMVQPNGEKYTEETWVTFTTAGPITVSIPAEGVDLEARTFQLVSNHPPSHVELEVLDDRQRVIGTSTFQVTDATRGKPVLVQWEQQQEGNIFRISATAHDDYGYWAAAEIIPWSLVIPHEDVTFETGKHDILADEAPKVDVAWKEIAKAVETYGAWVQCSLYVGGYTDTVGDGSSNQGLSERRALALARYFRAKGAKFPVYYQGFGESALAVQTADSVDEVRNRRATYIITAGPPPNGKDTPRRAWKKAP